MIRLANLSKLDSRFVNSPMTIAWNVSNRLDADAIYKIRWIGARLGIVCAPTRLSSIVEVKRIEGPMFNSKEAAEEHGIQLCKEWIDKQLDAPQAQPKFF